MKQLLMAGLALAVMVAGPAEARGHHHYGGSDYYTNVSGHRVHRPTYAERRPVGATAHCADGTWSFSEHHQGTCSHRGGVAEWE